MGKLFEEMFDRLKHYRELGLNPLSLACGCAVKVDLLRVVYPAIEGLKPQLRGSNLTIAPREDADIFPRSEGGVKLYRRIYSLDSTTSIDLSDIRSIGPSRAIVVIQVYQRYANNPEQFLKLIGPIYLRLAESGTHIYIGKGHSIITPFVEDQFILFDFIKASGGRAEGYTAVNNDTIHIVDPSQEPGDYRQVSGALSNSLNDIFVLGVYENLRIAPVFSAVSSELREKIWKNILLFSRRYNIDLIEVPQPNKGKLLVGSTSIGDTLKKPPVFADKVEVGMKLIATRPMGELAPINVYLSTIIDESLIREVEDAGISFEVLEKIKDKAVETISTPNIEAARVINRYLPRYDEEYDPTEHIALTTDVTGPGIYVVKEIAEKSRATLRLDSIPLLSPEVAEIATKLYIIPNATSGTNGAFIVVAPETIAQDILRDLRSRGLNASVIGEVVGRGEAKVLASSRLRKYVADQKLLMEFEIVREDT